MDSQDERCSRISDFQKGSNIRISCQLQAGQSLPGRRLAQSPHDQRGAEVSHPVSWLGRPQWGGT